MKKLMTALAGGLLAVAGAAPGAGQPAGSPASSAHVQHHPRAEVRLTVTDQAGRTVASAAMPAAERQRVTSLQSSLQQWGNQQGQRVSVTIRCT